MDREQQFCLRWNNFQANITSQFEALRDEEDFVDVTLACEGKHLKAHKVVLSACSPYFKELFKGNPCQHPIVFMRDVEYLHLLSLMEFMYTGEVNVSQTHLAGFLKTAEALQIRGLAEASQQKEDGKPCPISEERENVMERSASPQGSVESATPPRGAAMPYNFWQAFSQSLYSQPRLPPPTSQDLKDNGGDPGEAAPPEKRSRGAPSGGGNDEESRGSSHTDTHAVVKMEDTGEVSDSDESDGAVRNACDAIEGKVDVCDYMDGDGAHEDGTKGENNSLDASGSLSPDGTPQSQGGTGDMIPGPSLLAGDGALDAATVDQRKLHSLDPRPCPICNRMYSNLSNLRQHFRLIHTPQSVVCPMCGKPFKTELYLKRHLASFHEMGAKSSSNMAPPQPTQPTQQTPSLVRPYGFSPPNHSVSVSMAGHQPTIAPTSDDRFIMSLVDDQMHGGVDPRGNVYV